MCYIPPFSSSSEKEESVAQNKDEDQDFSADALSALVRPSAAPPPEPTEADEQGANGRAAPSDDDDAVLDLRALATSQAPPPPEVASPAKPVETKPSATKTAETKPSETKAKEPKPVREETAPAAVMTHPAPEARKSSGGMITGLVIGALVAGASVFFFARGDESAEPTGELAAAEPQSVAATAGHELEATEAATEETEPVPPAAPIEGAEAATAEGAAESGEPAAQEAATAAEPQTEAAGSSRRPRSARERRAATARSAASAEAAEPAAQEGAAAQGATRAQASGSTAEQPAQPEGGNRLDSVLDDALGGRPAAGGTRTVPSERPAASGGAAASADLPETPSRGDVARVLGRLLPQIRQCAADQVGLANATILVRNDGAVGSVAIAGHPFGGTPQGACMEGVIRRAQFSPFRQSTFRITYPFALRPTP